jgi:ribonuclease T2
MRTITVALLALTLAASALPSRRHHAKQTRGLAGNFDFYVLVLSWSPEFCYSHPSTRECSQHKGFLVHGLWPQNSDGTYPQNCQTNQPAPTSPESMSDIMPGEIVRHEWLMHGTCSGLSGDSYFALIRKLYSSIRIPDSFKQPASSATLSTSGMKRQFEQANSQLRDDEIVVQLRRNYLNSVQFCESKSPSPTPVTCSGLHDTRQGTFVVQPVR